MRPSRIALLAPLALALPGCASHWVANQVVDTSETEVAYFRDVDQDGWGSAELPGIMSLAPNVEDGFTAQNNRDCDDQTGSVTGHVAPLCPEALGEDIAPVVFGTSEYVVVKGSSDRRTRTFAADACGNYGWGGGLAAFEATDDFDQIRAAVTEESDWAAWVGVVAVGSSWAWDPASTDVVGGTLAIDSIGFCGSGASPSISADPARNHLALVKEGNDLCLGRPSDAGFTDDLAYFVCERPQPDVAEFILYHVPGTEE